MSSNATIPFSIGDFNRFMYIFDLSRLVHSPYCFVQHLDIMSNLFSQFVAQSTYCSVLFTIEMSSSLRILLYDTDALQTNI